LKIGALYSITIVWLVYNLNDMCSTCTVHMYVHIGPIPDSLYLLRANT